MRSKRENTCELRNQAGERRSCSPPRTPVMLLRGSQSSLMTFRRPATADSGYQLLILDSPITGAEDRSGRLWRCAAAYSVKVTLVLQNRYPLRDPRLQIVCRFSQVGQFYRLFTGSFITVSPVVRGHCPPSPIGGNAVLLAFLGLDLAQDGLLR